jgi:sterol desaturase/sphingolipid hydroxylase (fatty acid hydroxylase superfamily)
MAHQLFIDLVSRPALFALILFLIRAIVCFSLERMFPANHVTYRTVWLRDLGAWALTIYLFSPLAKFFDRLVVLRPTYPNAVLALPFAIRFIVFLLLVDFFTYWVHRLMHSRHVWRVHKWHHSPTYMYWLAGNRASVLQLGLMLYVYVSFDGLLFDAAAGPLAAFIAAFTTLWNDWLHVNVPWGSRWVEWFVTTPRYHRIHHSDDPAHYEKNLAGTFPIMDRLFGTYFDPDKARTLSGFGIKERVHPARMALGV